jgi:uncharacterized protein YjbI with pentapeptide repeats
MKDFIRRLQRIDNWTIFYGLAGLALASSVLSAVVNGSGADAAWWSAWLTSVSTEIIDAIFTFGLLYFVVGLGNEKKSLITDIRSQDKNAATTAIEQMRGKGWLQDGSLSGVSLFEAQWQKTRLQGANLAGASLWRANLHQADLQGATLRDAFLHYADLSQANLSDVDLSGAQLDYANLLAATLERTQFSETTTLPDGTPWTPTSDLARFTDRNHPQFWFGYNLTGQDVSGGNFADANLAGADLSQVTMIGATLRAANLAQAHLPYANLSQADGEGATLRRANLNNSNLSHANFAHANLEQANLKGANLFKANLAAARLHNAQIDENTILPDGTRLQGDMDERVKALEMMRFTNRDHPNFWRSDDRESPAHREAR